MTFSDGSRFATNGPLIVAFAVNRKVRNRPLFVHLVIGGNVRIGAVCGQSGNVRKSEEAASGLCLPIVADQQIETPWNAD
jgi:hypothetical protein